MKRFYNLFLCAVVTLCLSSCDNAFSLDDLHASIVDNGSISFNASDYQQGTFTTAEYQINTLKDSFATKAFNVVSQKSQGNVFFSPLSLEMATAMLCNGAAGNTQSEILKALGFEGYTVDDVNSYNRKVINQLQDNGLDEVLQISNSVWADKNLSFYSIFQQTNQSFYDAAVANLDFTSGKAANTINAWCKEKTNGHIDQIVSEEQLNNVICMLINTIYYQEEWESKFDATKTTDMDFTNSDGSKSTVKGMKKDVNTLVYKGNGYTRFGLRYKSGCHGFNIILPDEGKSIDDCLKINNAELFCTGWKNGMPTGIDSNIHLTLPKFTVENELNLIETLKSLGIKDAFNKYTADFSKLSPQELYISDVRQKTRMEMDEEGSKATAVTEVYLSIGANVSGDKEEPQEITITVNRPFLFYIDDSITHSILFMGKVVKL